jgi:hypothetical protein
MEKNRFYRWKKICHAHDEDHALRGKIFIREGENPEYGYGRTSEILNNME